MNVVVIPAEMTPCVIPAEMTPMETMENGLHLSKFT